MHIYENAIWVLNLKDNNINDAPNEQLFVRSGLWCPVLGQIIRPTLLTVSSFTRDKSKHHRSGDSHILTISIGITSINTKYMDQCKNYG